MIQTLKKRIFLESVTVEYSKSNNKFDSLKETFVNVNKRTINKNTLYALNDISITVNSGEIYGIIGKNGVGKSTLLKVISGIVIPTAGRARTWGNVVPLLRVGAGFHEELTGRENIFLYSSVLGRSRTKTKELFAEIVGFSELEDFLDTPIRNYSTGMRARLGFSIAMAEHPDILLIDEILAVGDAAFQNKCLQKFNDIKNNGATIIIVSHSMPTVESMCTHTIWIEKGEILKLGNTKNIVQQYKDFSRKEINNRNAQK